MKLLNKIKSLLTRKKSHEEAPPFSVVFLMRKPMQLTPESVQSAFVKVLGRDFDSSRNELVVAASPTSFVRVDGQVFMLHDMGFRYVDDLDQSVTDARDESERQILRQHNAWFSIDCMFPQRFTNAEKENVYRRMLRLGAEFLNSDCLGIYLPESGVLVPVNALTQSTLRTENAVGFLSSYRQDPIVSVPAADSGLEAAAHEAQDRWPEFRNAFAERKSDQHFFVKLPFRDGEAVEWMWLDVMRMDSDYIEGTLNNSPKTVSNVQENEKVRAPIGAIADWIVQDGEKWIGGFSLPAIRQASKQ